MCGIIGIVGKAPVQERLIETLRRLEYRGYDSAGVAMVAGSRVDRRRAQGKIRALEDVLRDQPLDGLTGVGHTRWATHGAPSQTNAHPHRAGRVTLVHNGIIENFAELKAELVAEGRTFESETDTEVIPHLIDRALAQGLAPLDALKSTLDRLRGAFALAVLIDGEDELILGARRGSPLVVGYGDGEMYLGSDALAVGPMTNQIAYLDEGDFVAIDRTTARIFDAEGRPVTRQIRIIPPAAALVEKGNYRHFMEKEIHDQPGACQHTLSAYLDPVSGRARAPDGLDFSLVDRIQIVACGTAYYAGLISRYLFESLARIPVDIDVASEFRYRAPPVREGTLCIVVSQSGETADTLAALRWCREQGLATAALVNVHTSTMAREADILLPTHAGPEIGVASTKAFTSQVAALSALAVAAASAKGRIDAAEEARLTKLLLEAPRLISAALALEAPIRALAPELAKARDVLYFGRGVMSALALEGALKLKEISYIHAEGYPAGELKHGPIALIDEATPVIVLAPSDALFEKTVSNTAEVMARGGPVIFITDEEGARRAPAGVRLIVAPGCDDIVAPLVYAVPIQMLAYYVAVQKGADVDQPRNLAKSVTVE
ncbi:glutamine--fructose-6-phosphate transaminase (isomerizing) [Phenylobacterium sp.]|uniref:glutamine--fructose-6-phosphate transaminase (isomerizing) n=1 Tax=Phenylobacterium sp. TaxID=1871053 RepID=UPI0025F52896|nr:glutamine--fructose-6-phosphate transaminase (isomerizing) [Phenylobacterium sp.]MCA6311219.1 glutamine--fructose-6-phosphate transaminase (isomerizing) [Phenylobacterium sp.]MCA6339632.1 glutamine--fructose-6-phosphate transaminase (isomerizing) [Phenylobacterium sp.]MCA6346601.1 glutamine--fructose-6-phosphate transaminase (isomerizing) [Phenylobacterium sp.]MCA6353284.1 glutamine--fructose-6-phosphate transaminase (isomerizing) [Phenylobacterium sp.]